MEFTLALEFTFSSQQCQFFVIDRLEELGIEEGDTVRVGDYLEFDYYRA